MIKHCYIFLIFADYTNIQYSSMDFPIFIDQHFVFGGQIDHFFWRSFGLQKDVRATYQEEPRQHH
ncbi:hypothetical protein D8B22_08840 [Verminephrobacter aporrectodeae subsp. tuberculatae]|nr:hypothetical protein [Verminephrobacter aporrectodeae subsp. tuberculatae]MCW8169209.1 hypothetical protein [Verminephrobacter aporrectodeae subsp. tuberculatae]